MSGMTQQRLCELTTLCLNGEWEQRRAAANEFCSEIERLQAIRPAPTRDEVCLVLERAGCAGSQASWVADTLIAANLLCESERDSLEDRVRKAVYSASNPHDERPEALRKMIVAAVMAGLACSK